MVWGGGGVALVMRGAFTRRWDKRMTNKEKAHEHNRKKKNEEKKKKRWKMEQKQDTQVAKGKEELENGEERGI
jgi:hypothetical protein